MATTFNITEMLIGLYIPKNSGPLSLEGISNLTCVIFCDSVERLKNIEIYRYGLSALLNFGWSELKIKIQSKPKQICLSFISSNEMWVISFNSEVLDKALTRFVTNRAFIDQTSSPEAYPMTRGLSWHDQLCEMFYFLWVHFYVITKYSIWGRVRW